MNQLSIQIFKSIFYFVDLKIDVLLQLLKLKLILHWRTWHGYFKNKNSTNKLFCFYLLSTWLNVGYCSEYLIEFFKWMQVFSTAVAWTANLRTRSRRPDSRRLRPSTSRRRWSHGSFSTKTRSPTQSTAGQRSNGRKSFFGHSAFAFL